MTNVLLSHPRSGNSYLRTLLSYSSSLYLPDGRFNNYLLNGEVFNCDLHQAIQTQSLLKSHNLYKTLAMTKRLGMTEFTESYFMGKLRLVFIVRDPRELILRNKFSSRPRYESIKEWADTLMSFEYYNGQKMLVNFVNLVKDPVKAALEVLQFLDAFDNEKYYFLSQNIESIRKQSFDLYTKTYKNNSFSSGDQNTIYDNKKEVKWSEVYDCIPSEYRTKYSIAINKYIGNFE